MQERVTFVWKNRVLFDKFVGLYVTSPSRGKAVNVRRYHAQRYASSGVEACDTVIFSGCIPGDGYLTFFS
jgi:hypothetical protein